MKMNHLPSETTGRQAKIRCLSLFSGSILLLLLTGMGAQTTHAQTVLNAAGDSRVIDGNYYAYSIGEMVLVGTAESGSIIVTQGVLQPIDQGVGIVDHHSRMEKLKVYPNPASDFVILQPDFPPGTEMIYELYDLSGRLLLHKAVLLRQGQEQQRLNVDYLAVGSYLLHAIIRQGPTTFNQSFKIQKLQ